MAEDCELTTSAKPATIKLRTPEEITDRLNVLDRIRKELLLRPPDPGVDAAIRQIESKTKILRWVLGDLPHI